MNEALHDIFEARVAGEMEWLRYLADSDKRNNDLVELAKRPEVNQALGMT